MKSIKCVVVGDSCVGKTCMLRKYTTNHFDTYERPIKTFDNYYVNTVVSNLPVSLDLYDTSGGKEFDHLRPSVYPDTDVFLICFSLASPSSLKNVYSKWFREVRKHCPNTPMVLVGTTIDKSDEKLSDKDSADSNDTTSVSNKNGLSMAQRICALKYLECNLPSQNSVKNVFTEILLSIFVPLPVKCVFVGDTRCGKSALAVRYIKGLFLDYNCPTIMNDYYTELFVDGRLVNLYIHEPAGDEDFARLRVLSYPETDVFLIFFSVNERYSFESILEKWCPEVRKHSPDVPIVLVCTMVDLRDDQSAESKPLSYEEGLSLAKKIGAVKYVECSARTPYNVETVFQEAVRAVINKRSDTKRNKPKITKEQQCLVS